MVKFIARQDADDESLKERLALQISNLIKNDVDSVFPER